MKIGIVIPTYNEHGNIGKLAKQIFALNIPNVELIIVDDSSADGTVDVIRALRKRFPVTLILRPKKLGLGSALHDGLTLAKNRGVNVVITMDSDLSHNPQTIPSMLRTLEGGADLVIGSRRIKDGKIIGWGPIRAAMSRTAMEFARLLLKIKTKDVTSGFRAYRRNILETINLAKLRSTGYAFQEEMLYRTEQKGFKVVEIPIQFTDRQEGRSKLGIKDIVEFFVTVMRLWQSHDG